MPLGLYLHIPFCRKRCHFCYFRVYTDKNAQEVGDYLDVLAREWELYATLPAIAGRPLNFVYFGGGTPSFLSTKQLEGLVGRLTAVTPWHDAEEITFECEPGTLTEPKLAAIRGIGVTRLSLGVENFDDEILELNGRAHRSPEICRAYEFARSLGFPQINIDLIAGMLGETDENWRDCVEKTLELAARQRDHLPDGAAVQHDDQRQPAERHRPVRAAGGGLVDEAALGARKRSRRSRRAGYHVGSAYTAVKDPDRTRFIYTDRLWQGADMVGLGVASFGHINGVHMQNLDTWETYTAAIRRGEIPLSRAYRPTRRGAADPRARPAAEARLDSAGVLPRQVQRGRPASVSASSSIRSLPTAISPSAANSASLSRAKGCCASMGCSGDSFCRSTQGFDTRREDGNGATGATGRRARSSATVRWSEGETLSIITSTRTARTDRRPSTSDWTFAPSPHRPLGPFDRRCPSLNSPSAAA